MNKQRILVLALATSLLGLMSPLSHSAENSGQRRPHHGPPPEAIEACKGKQVDDKVSFTGRMGEALEAICQERDGQMVAMPTSMPERGPRQ